MPLTQHCSFDKMLLVTQQEGASMKIQYDDCWNVVPTVKNISAGLEYVVKNLLNVYGLRFSSVSIYANLEDYDGNKVVPGIEGQGITVRYNLYTKDVTVEPNPSEWLDPKNYLPIESALHNYNQLPLFFTDEELEELAQFKQAVQTTGITVRRLEQITGIDGASICNYLSELTPIPAESMPILMAAVEGYNSTTEEELAQKDKEIIRAILEPQLGHRLSPPELARATAYTLRGLTDTAFRLAIDRTITKTGKLSFLYMCAILDAWAKRGSYAGEPYPPVKRNRL